MMNSPPMIRAFFNDYIYSQDNNIDKNVLKERVIAYSKLTSSGSKPYNNKKSVTT